MSEDWGAVAKAIQERAAELRMSQAELGKRSHVGKSIVHELWHNTERRNRRPDTLERLSEALGWHKHHLAYVVQGKQPPEPSQPVDGIAGAPRLDAIEDRLDEIANRLGVIDARLARLDAMDAKLTKVLRRIDIVWPNQR